MDQLEINWTSTALKQRNRIFNYWNTRNKNSNYSKKLNIIIKQRITLLAVFPEMGKITIAKDVKGISLENYSIFYKTTSTKIIIVAFWDNRQDFKKLIKFLKSN